MSNPVEDIRKKSDFDEKDCFFLDTNVWLYIYYGIYSEQDRYFKKWYTDAFEKMLLCNCKIFVDFLVLSEFVNRFARLEYDRKMPPIKREPNRNNYKIFRKSGDGQNTAREIVININKILNKSELCDLDYNCIKPKLSAQLKEYEKFDSDFNDLIYVELCKEKKFTFVTHDGDFNNHDIRVLTANNAMLSR